MVKVLKTKSGYYLVFKDDVTLTDDEVRRYKDTEYNDRRIKNVSDFHEKFSKADAGLTKALMAEIPLAPFLDKQVKNELSGQNELKKRIEQIEKRTGLRHAYLHYDIAGTIDDCPVSFVHGERFYFPKYDSKRKKYVIYDEAGKETHVSYRYGECWEADKKVVLFDNVFFFTPQEVETIKRITSDIKKYSTSVLAKEKEQNLALYSFYTKMLDDYTGSYEGKAFTVNHELHHAQTAYRIEQRRQEADYVELSPKNASRLNEDKEKSATLQEVYVAISLFAQRGGDLSVFSRKQTWLVNKIRNLSFEQQKQILSDHSFLVNGNIESWDKLSSDGYFEQRRQAAMGQAWSSSVLRMEEGDAEYLACRSCAYTMRVYNIRTGKWEEQDLSRFIKRPTVVRENEHQYLEKAEMIRSKRLRILNENGIDLKLILSLLDGTYPEPFQAHSFEQLSERFLKQGITFKSKSDTGLPIQITVKKHSLPDRPNCITISGMSENKETFRITSDRDKHEYVYCDSDGNKYSNALGEKYPQAPETVKKQVRKYQREADKTIRFKVMQILGGNGGSSLSA